MTVPAEAALRVLWALGVGGFLGMVYDFLRPLRRRHHAPADGVFVLALLLCWIWYSFRICGGDIRFGGTVSLGIGILLWMNTGSRIIRRLFYWFWYPFFWIFSVLTLPFVIFFKKISKIIKKVFAYGKKRGYNNRCDRNPPQPSGGIYYDE